MAGKLEGGGGETGDGVSPPYLAHALLSFAADASDKSVLIGDLEEEYGELLKRSRKSARTWYWRQAQLSLPHLIMKRLRTEQARQFGLAIIAITGALAITAVWDLYVARTAASGFYALTSADSYGPARAIFLATQMAGVAIAGALVAFLTFSRRQTFMRNVVRRLAPSAVIFFAPAVVDIITAPPDYPATFRLFWILFAAPSFTAGAWIVFRYRSGRHG